ncbi:uncharacterized protein LOC131597001 [Vicia villosa]|uniref:uncharacterized protein LOC131597001 n=1 Tax=Vicia villosa TaxID=3911 RepID=UPI00273AFE07|nr:uncharacterized protein LOC131597001 [Vicia villosa]
MTEDMVNLDELSDNDLITIMMPGLTKKLRSRKGKVVATFTPTKTNTRYGPSKPLSKEIPNFKKRKIRDTANSESDTEDDVQDILIKKKYEMKNLSVHMLDAPMDNISFHSKENVDQWKVRDKDLDYADPRSKEFKKVYVRGRCVEFSPSVINRYLKDKLPASKLSVKYAIMHSIGVANWVHTNNSSVISHVGSCAVKMPISFPTIICGIILSQHLGILRDTDAMPKRKSVLSLHFKLVVGKHVPDIALTSASVESKTSTKAGMISELVEACK